MGSCMKYIRIIGKRPRQIVQRFLCRKCNRPVAQFPEGLRCLSCRGEDFRLATVDEWQQVHAVESQRHKRGMIPDAVYYDRGSDETEARSARAKMRDPAAQVWFDYSRDDTYLHTDRFAVLHIKSARIIADMVPPEIVDAAEQVFVRQGVLAAQAMQSVFEVVKYSIDRLRENAGPLKSQRIPRKAIASEFGLDVKSVKAYTRVHVGDRSKGDTGARQGYRYSPPLAQLLDAIETAVKTLESRF